MTSLAQVSIYGIAGFVLGNCVTTGETKGLNLGLNPWVGIVLAVVIATAVAFALGAVASRSTGIYFLMLTLSFAVMVNYFFGQVTVVSGFGGLEQHLGIHLPGVLGRPDQHPNRLYYTALLVASRVCLLRYLLRTPFGLVLQGIRDDPLRMSLARVQRPAPPHARFGVGRLHRSFAGVIFVWWNNRSRRARSTSPPSQPARDRGHRRPAAPRGRVDRRLRVRDRLELRAGHRLPAASA